MWGSSGFECRNSQLVYTINARCASCPSNTLSYRYLSSHIRNAARNAWQVFCHLTYSLLPNHIKKSPRVKSLGDLLVDDAFGALTPRGGVIDNFTSIQLSIHETDGLSIPHRSSATSVVPSGMSTISPRCLCVPRPGYVVDNRRMENRLQTAPLSPCEAQRADNADGEGT